MVKLNKDEKASQYEAKNALGALVENFIDIYEIKFTTDTGGSMMELHIEMDDTKQLLKEQYPLFPVGDIVPKWMGWRLCIIKVPAGTLDTVIKPEE